MLRADTKQSPLYMSDFKNKKRRVAKKVSGRSTRGQMKKARSNRICHKNYYGTKNKFQTSTELKSQRCFPSDLSQFFYSEMPLDNWVDQCVWGDFTSVSKN